MKSTKSKKVQKRIHSIPSVKNKFWQYIDQVNTGEVLTCKWVKLAVKRFEKDLKRKDLEWREEEGMMVVELFEKVLKHWDGPKAGKPLILEPHQVF